MRDLLVWGWDLASAKSYREAFIATLASFSEPSTLAQVAAATQFSPASARAALESLEREKLVARSVRDDGETVWALTAKGRR